MHNTVHVLFRSMPSADDMQATRDESSDCDSASEDGNQDEVSLEEIGAGRLIKGGEKLDA